MKKIIDNMKRAFNKFLNYYMECMRQYGDAMLRGGSYGCA